MAIHRGVAVPREMLGASQNTGLLQSLRESDTVLRDGARVAAKAPIANHRVVGIGVHIHDRREVEIEPQSGQFLAKAFADTPREFDAARTPELTHGG